MRAALLTVLLLAGVANPGAAQVAQTKALVSSGGAHSSAGNVTMTSSVGDIVAGRATGVPLDVWHGFYAPKPVPVVGVEGPKTSFVSYLGRISPNPASGSLTIEFGNGVHQPVGLDVYDVAGRLVRTLSRGPLDAGVFRLPWDLRSNDGQSVGTGMYFVRLSASGFTRFDRVVVVR